MQLDGVSALGVSPNFGPGSGWHKTPPMAIPWSHADRIARRSAAYWCTVFLMRQQGVRLPAAVVLRERQPVSGALVAEQLGSGWSAHLYDDDVRTEQLFLGDVILRRQKDGYRLYLGTERDRFGKPQWLQTWLCAPSADQGREILKTMVERERTTAGR